MRLFCFGFGYSARTLAAHLPLPGPHIVGTCRDPGAAPPIAGVDLVAFNGLSPLAPHDRQCLRHATHILLSIPPAEDGDPVLALHAADIAAAGACRWIGYLSSTGVYGDHKGAWVDEATAPRPRTARARRRLAAERAWQALAARHGLPLHIFRLAGIYGPGRNAFMALKSGRAHRIISPGHVSSRIHVADLAAVILASMAQPRPGAIYNVCDDMPASPADVVAYAAARMGVVAPPPTALEEAGLSAFARSFYSESRRVSNRRIRDELGVRLRYPDYRSGLDALWKSEIAGGT
ncbi:MAG: NAD-dependent epimerase/dehydratase family protein [Alphaproteobacteria bacterium]|nr:MAG: NAD-dependent epimerase/dehydratase family protein [Alphaproteobacteria bacterium]